MCSATTSVDAKRALHKQGNRVAERRKNMGREQRRNKYAIASGTQEPMWRKKAREAPPRTATHTVRRGVLLRGAPRRGGANDSRPQAQSASKHSSEMGMGLRKVYYNGTQ